MPFAFTRSRITLCVAAFAGTTLACAPVGRTDPLATVPSDSNSFVVRDVRVFDGERTIERTNVVVRSGRIASVGESRGTPDLPVVEGSGRTLFPGLIDTHAHVQNDNSLRNALRFGVTTQLDMFTKLETLRSRRGTHDETTKTDLSDFYSAGQPVTSPGGMGTQFGIPFPTISGPQEAMEFVRARAAEGSEYIKILYEPKAGIVTTISRETLTAVVAAAHAQGLLAVVHITALEGARDVVAAHADGLAHLFGDELIDDALIKQMVGQHMFVTPTLSFFAAMNGASVGPSLAADPRLAPFLSAGQRTALVAPKFDKDNPMAPYLVRFNLARVTENVRRLHSAGVPILAGDDVPNVSAFGVSMHGELEFLTKAGLSPAEALTAATRGPANAFKLTDRGRISAGARADLVLVEGNPLVDITASRAILHVYKNGFEVTRTPPAPAPPTVK